MEPNATQAEAIKLKLEAAGIEVILCDSETAAARCGQQACDLALIDLHQGEVSGPDLARNLGSVPAIILLTPRGFRLQEAALPANVKAAVSKPIRRAALWQSLEEILQPSSSPPTAQPEIPTLASRYPLRFLLAEDNLINQKVALRLLSQLGYDADVANNGQEALDAATRCAYDVIIMDVQMPLLDGLEATRRIRELEERLGPARTRRCAIIGLTANAVSGDREKCLAAGMDDYMSKPVRSNTLRDIIEDLGARLLAWDPNRGRPADPEESAENQTEMSDIPNAPTPGGPPPVDIDKLRDLGGGTDEGLAELIDLYLEQTEGQIGEIQAAITAANAPEIRRVAHSCAGANATCGMDGLVAPMRELERMGNDGDIAHAQAQLDLVRSEFVRIKAFLEGHRG